MIDYAIKRAFEQMEKRGWDTLYWAIDIHDVLIEGSYTRMNDGKAFCPGAVEVLQWLSQHPVMRTILWTSSHDDATQEFVNWASEHDIHFDYINKNPECPTNDLACFDKGKFYFNILLEDKAGFNWKEDWFRIKDTLIEIGEWDKNIVVLPFNGNTMGYEIQ